jgi:hypothetical protein
MIVRSSPEAKAETDRSAPISSDKQSASVRSVSSARSQRVGEIESIAGMV